MKPARASSPYHCQSSDPGLVAIGSVCVCNVQSGSETYIQIDGRIGNQLNIDTLSTRVTQLGRGFIEKSSVASILSVVIADQAAMFLVGVKNTTHQAVSYAAQILSFRF